MEGYNYKTLSPLVEHCLNRKVSVLITGHPGVGKSSMARDLANKMGFEISNPSEFIDIRLAQKDPVELCGVLAPNRETRISEFYRPSWLPVEKPAFIFLDEINAGVTKLHQAAAYQIVLERRVGDYLFHPDTVILAAGNLEEDNSIVTPLSNALQDRFARFILDPDVDTWLQWAAMNGVDAGMRGYISFRGSEALYKNDSDIIITPRSWERASRLNGLDDKIMLQNILSGVVGQAEAMKYMAYLEVYSKIDIFAILEKGILPKIEGQELSFIYALVFSIADAVRLKRVATNPLVLNNLVSVFNVLPEEFQAMLLKELLMLDKEISGPIGKHPSMFPIISRLHMSLGGGDE